MDRDFETEMKKLLESLSDVDAEAAQDEVHRAFRYDLCPPCWRRYLKDPLGGCKPVGGSEAEGEEKKKSQGD